MENRKPRLVVIEPDRRYRVTYPCGGTAELWYDGEGFNEGWHWHAERANGLELRRSQCHRATTMEGAFRAAWCQVRPSPAPLVGVTLERLRPLENADRSVYTKALRKMLRDRTGRTWSVKGSTGTAYGWIIRTQRTCWSLSSAVSAKSWFPRLR